jgi:hypothetical protein
VKKPLTEQQERREKQHADLVIRAKKTRDYISKNPGKSHKEITFALKPMKAPVMWLYMKNFIVRSYPENGGQPIYFVKPL